MDLFHPEQSCWATLRANNAYEICDFSVENIKIMDSWYVMWWCLTHRYQHRDGTWHFHLQG